MRSWLFSFPLCALALTASPAEPSIAPCRIEVVEKGSGWPVPLVELRTTNGLKWVTDNAGLIACDAPEVLGRETWFYVTSPGYGVKPDGFKIRGVRVKPEAGGSLKIEVERESIARRLGRLTGGGIFAESQRLGGDKDWRESGVFGCDSVQNAVYRGRLFWLWGDTTLPRYPLGIFHSTGGFTAEKPLARFEPPLRLPIDLLRDAQGAPRGIAPMPGDGPTWVTACATLPDKTGTPRLVGSFMKIHSPLEVYQWGLCAWNDDTASFDLTRAVWQKSAATPKAPPVPEGHAALWKDEAGKEWALFGNPLPRLRCPATFEAWQDSATWEVLQPQASFRAAGSGDKVVPHTGSIAWHPWRKRWVTVFMQSGGQPSSLGELWYAEADAPTGPWGSAVKVLSHDNYTFYNPRVHGEWASADSPVLVFEGTYTEQFTKGAKPTPRYDYNQILYRLDLDDPALKPAQEK